MKIAILTTNPTSRDDRIYYKLGRSLARFAEVFILNPRYAPDAAGNPRIIGVEKPLSILATRAWMLEWLRETGMDIVQVTDPLLLPAALTCKQELSVKIVYDPAEDWPGMFHDFSRKPWPLPQFMGWGMARFEKKYTRMCDHGIATDDWLEQHLRRLGLSTTTINNFPNHDLFTAAPTDQHDHMQVVYHGQLRRERGVLDAIEALAQVRQTCPGATLLLVGSWSYPEEREQVADLIRYHDLDTVVEIRPAVSHPEIPKLLSRAGIGLVPFQDIGKFRHNVATKLFEYMACQLPIVATDLSPARRFIESTKAGILVEPGSAQALAEGMLTLLKDPQLADEMGQNGYKAFLDRYNWEAQEARLKALYKEVL